MVKTRRKREKWLTRADKKKLAAKKAAKAKAAMAANGGGAGGAGGSGGTVDLGYVRKRHHVYN